MTAASNSFNAVNNPEYFQPPTTGTLGRWVYDKFHPLVIGQEHHIGFVQKLFGLPTKQEHLLSLKASDSKAPKTPKSRYFGVDFIMRAASELGNELFYGLWAVFMSIYIDMEVSQTLVILWVLSMYIGQLLKDICRLPRPGLGKDSSILRLDSHYAAEYGFPSTHTACASTQPLALLYFIFTKYDISSPVYSPMTLFAVVSFCLFWFFVTPISRLYLGVHSTIDLIGGYAIGFGLLIPFISFQSYIFPFMSSPLGAFMTLLFLIITLATYCRPKDHWTSSPGDTAVVSGAGCGILIGFALNELFEVSPPIFRVVTVPQTAYDFFTAAIQLPIGLAIAYGCRHAVKPIACLIAKFLANILYGKLNSDGKFIGGIGHREKMSFEEKTLSHKYFVELCDKGAGYFAMGFLCTLFFIKLTNAIGWTYMLPSPSS